MDEAEVNPDPLTVTLASTPIGPAPGLTNVSVGTGGFVTLNEAAFEVGVSAVGQYAVIDADVKAVSNDAGIVALRV